MEPTVATAAIPHPLWSYFNEAAEVWGFNCGPAAVCGVLELLPGQVQGVFKRHGFANKRYTNPKMMFEVLSSLIGDRWNVLSVDRWPMNGLIRVQWSGPWTNPGVPIRVAYRHTHWIGSREAPRGREVFDVNCACVGGWVPYLEWSGSVVPWLLKTCQPKADGKWWPTHVIETRLAAHAGGMPAVGSAAHDGHD